ncbi:unnamed protein product [Ectocarpus fasciculatus]
MPDTSGTFMCDGIQRGDFCCSAGCGECGGVGCSNRGDGLDGDDCCQSNIEDNGNICSVTGKAPCMIVDVPDVPDAFVCDGVQKGDFCCSAGCGECGGVGCSSRGDGLDGDDCCQSNIEDNGNMCSVTGKAPCMID